MTSHNSLAKNKFQSMLLYCLAAFSAFRLLAYSIRFGRSYLSSDFSDYYTAGESLNAGLSPYLNWVFHYPSIWDGATTTTYSGFRYPPQVAELFRLFAYLPYGVAKFAWLYLSIICVSISIYLVLKIDKKMLKKKPILIMVIIVSLFEPLYMHLERGQIDALNMLLLVSAIYLMTKRRKGRDGTLATINGLEGFASGGLIALATLFKLHSIYFVPFLIFRRKWKELAGFMIMGLLLVAFMIPFGGLRPLDDYVRNELPRFASMDLGRDLFIDNNTVNNEYPRGLKQGKVYQIMDNLNVASSGTLVWGVSKFVSGSDMAISPYLSPFFFVILFLVVIYFYWRRERKMPYLSELQEFAFWQIVMIVILLSGLGIWWMNSIWLLPIAIIIMYWYSILRTSFQSVVLIACTAGFLIDAMPDEWGNLPLLPNMPFLKAQYIFAELILLASLIYFISMRIDTAEENQI